jgi:hypothetical protein
LNTEFGARKQQLELHDAEDQAAADEDRSEEDGRGMVSKDETVIAARGRNLSTSWVDHRMPLLTFDWLPVLCLDPQ